VAPGLTSSFCDDFFPFAREQARRYNRAALGGARLIQGECMATELPQGYRPSDEEPFMNERQREYFRRKLVAWKEDILRESRETIQNLQSSLPPTPIWLTARPRKPSVSLSCARATASAN
jgi:hypothetical protein